MSAVKNPEQKKQLALNLERRNVYGENSKSSRKNIKRGKQLRHMDERRSARDALRRLNGQVQEDDAATVELLTESRTIDSKRRGFKKVPDVPLVVVLARKTARKSQKSTAR
jgi:hypothetical protein